MVILVAYAACVEADQPAKPPQLADYDSFDGFCLNIVTTAEREELIAVFEAVWPSEGAPLRPGPSACFQERPCRIFAVQSKFPGRR